MLNKNVRKAVKGVFVTLGLLALAGTVHAVPVTITFQNPNADLPTGGLTTGGNCNGTPISSSDFCETGAGLNYLKSGLSVNVTADNTDNDAFLMQDLAPANSGLAVISPSDTRSDDQVQVASGESILFNFGSRVDLLGFDFNNGNDRNCSSTGNEGDCGFFDLFIDGASGSAGNFGAIDDLVFGTAFSGTTFRVAHTSPNDGGFAIGSVTVASVPEPGTLALLGLGLAGLSLTRRRKS
jgi:hypothetical protein